MIEKLNFDEIKKIIKKILDDNNLNYEKIILFGSRAKQNHNFDSDVDILIIIEKQLNDLNKMFISKLIRVALAKYYINNNIKAGTDIIIKTKNEVEYYKNKISAVVKEALAEGITL